MAFANGASRTSTATWRELRRWARWHLPYECARCGIDGRDCRLELDHIKPHAEGGTDERDNVAWLCPTCHGIKTKAEAKRGRARAVAEGRWGRRQPRVPARQRVHPSDA